MNITSLSHTSSFDTLMAVTKAETTILFQYSAFQPLLAITLNLISTSYRFLLQCIFLIMASWWSDEV